MGEDQCPTASSGFNVVIEPARRARRNSRVTTVQLNHRRIRSQNGGRGRRGGRVHMEAHVDIEGDASVVGEEDKDRHAEEFLYRNNLQSMNESDVGGREHVQNQES